MAFAPKPRGVALVKSALVGSFGGIMIQLLLTARSGPLSWDDIESLPFILLFYGLFALPFVAIALVVFGLPAAALFGRWSDKLLVAAAAVVLGAISGKLFFDVMDHLLFSGSEPLGTVRYGDPGISFGVPTGLAWWYFKGRALRQQASAESQDDTSSVW